MTEKPQLTESDIRRWIDEASFGRGQGYLRHGNIVNPRRQGNTLKARCLGSSPTPYYVEVALGQKGVVSGDCSCPIGGGGHCKHAAALLLTWVHQPDAFLEMEELEMALERRSKTELIALICRMVDRDPDLELLLELPIIGEETPQPVDADVIRRQASHAFSGIGPDEWGAVYGIAQQLEDLVDIGDGYAERECWRDAATVYRLVAQETLDNYSMVDDQSGDLNDVVNRCVEGLGDCLAAEEDAVRREGLLRVLFDVYHWDMDFGGIDMGYQAPTIILDQATAEERQKVARWVRQAMPAGDTWSSNYHRQAYGGFLLHLEEDLLDDEAFLRICRETGRWRDLVDRLLALGRVNEAVAAACQVGDYDLLQLAEIFTSHDQGDVVEKLIRERAQTSDDSRLTTWLKNRAQERGDVATALALAEGLFWRRPGMAGYQELKELAQSLEQWNDLRVAVLARLADDKGEYDLLTEIHLEEGDVSRALETVQQTRAARWGWVGDQLYMRVAQAAEKDYPREAIGIYMAQVERLIAARGRGSYTAATEHLVRVRNLYYRLGEHDAWQALITNLREQNRRLRALKEELNKAGL